MAVYLLLKTFATKWQSLLYSKHSSQNGGPSSTQNINYKMTVSLIIETSTRWQSLCYSKYAKDGSPSDTTFKIRQYFCYSKHSLQNGSPSDTQNIHHKMSVSLLPKTLTRWQCLRYSEYSYLVFLKGYPTVFRCNWNLNVPTQLKLPDTKFHYQQFASSPCVILAQKQKHYPEQTINATSFEPRASRTRSTSANLSREIFIRL